MYIWDNFLNDRIICPYILTSDENMKRTWRNFTRKHLKESCGRNCLIPEWIPESFSFFSQEKFLMKSHFRLWVFFTIFSKRALRGFLENLRIHMKLWKTYDKFLGNSIQNESESKRTSIFEETIYSMSEGDQKRSSTLDQKKILENPVLKQFSETSGVFMRDYRIKDSW